jgi:hypothetical protein
MPRTLYVTNVSPGVARVELEGLFAAHGTIRAVAVLRPFQTADGASTAFVEMDSEADGEAAIAALNGASHHGAALAVRWAIPRSAAGASSARGCPAG